MGSREADRARRCPCQTGHPDGIDASGRRGNSGRMPQTAERKRTCRIEPAPGANCCCAVRRGCSWRRSGEAGGRRADVVENASAER